ncbi:hypothetical protein T484DRAFT_1751575 [Baffinella frigidus]|nr:hypothetical protein T484DRAFT_1751575 [Cryptophyta sp. CCMP2293]
MMAGSAVLGTIALLLAGRVLFGRTQTTSTKAACLCISFIWAGQAIKFLETTCGIDSTRVAAGSEQKPWPAQGFLSALCYGLVSGVLTVSHQPSASHPLLSPACRTVSHGILACLPRSWLRRDAHAQAI